MGGLIVKTEVVVQSRERNGRTNVGVKLSIIEVLDNILDRLDIAVPLASSVFSPCSYGTHSLGSNIHLEVSTDEELATHLD